jgi:uncharacterized protein (TIGR02001 family)
MSKFVIWAVVAAAIALPLPALAKDGWSGDVTVASEYISKGAGKSGGDPHASLRLERGFGGNYAGAWFGNVETSQGADSEIHLYAGRTARWAGAEFDVRAFYKTLPGTRDGVQEDHLEFRADAARSLAGNKLRLRVEFAPDGYATAEEAWWIEGQASRKLTPKLTGSVALGAREQNGGSDYTAWNAGLRYAVSERLGVDLRWYDTDSHRLSDNHEGRLVAAATVGF